MSKMDEPLWKDPPDILVSKDAHRQEVDKLVRSGRLQISRLHEIKLISAAAAVGDGYSSEYCVKHETAVLDGNAFGVCIDKGNQRFSVCGFWDGDLQIASVRQTDGVGDSLGGCEDHFDS